MNGLIAFFDILGYQSFLENNSATESAEKVLKLITDIPNKVRADTSKAWSENAIAKKESEETAAASDHLIFSDTIVLSIKYPENATEQWKANALFLLSATCGKLWIDMFKEGLPLRGAIVEGGFIVKASCFAGKAIIDAYKLCASLNFSGVVIDKQLNTRLANAGGDATELSKHFVDYLAPKKEANEQKMLHINLLDFVKKDELAAIKLDIEAFVLRSFWAHNKDCPRAVDEKIANTVKLLRRFVIALEKN